MHVEQYTIDEQMKGSEKLNWRINIINVPSVIRSIFIKIHYILIWKIIMKNS